jgi:hypothetical protein
MLVIIIIIIIIIIIRDLITQNNGSVVSEVTS